MGTSGSLTYSPFVRLGNRRLSSALMLMLLLACTPDFEPVSCDDVDHHCLQGQILDSIGRGLEGAEICNLDDPDLACALTDRDGGFQMPGLPTRGRLTFLTVLEGFQSVIDPHQAELLPRTQWEAYMVADKLAEVRRTTSSCPWTTWTWAS